MHHGNEKIVQMAYVVNDLEAAIRYWSAAVGAGPFFAMTVEIPDGTYRGEKSHLVYDAAFGFHGDMNIELIAQPNDTPSVYREMLDSSGPGFHHFMVRTPEIEATIARYQANGIAPAFRAEFAGAGPWAYLDARDQGGSYVELYQMPETVEEMWAAMQAAHRDWNGDRPMRAIADLG